MVSVIPLLTIVPSYRSYVNRNPFRIIPIGFWWLLHRFRMVQRLSNSDSGWLVPHILDLRVSDGTLGVVPITPITIFPLQKVSYAMLLLMSMSILNISYAFFHYLLQTDFKCFPRDTIVSVNLKSSIFNSMRISHAFRYFYLFVKHTSIFNVFFSRH